MGISTDALLYFGFDFYNEESGYGEIPWLNENEDNVHDWDSVYAEACGIIDESNLFNEAGEYAVPEGPERDRRDKIHDIYTEKKSKLIESIGVEIGTHCSHEYPIWFVFLKKHSYTDRGFPQAIDPKKLSVTEKEIESLKDFCLKVGIKFKKPHWHLASYWG
jgi:hypothetical protein